MRLRIVVVALAATSSVLVSGTIVDAAVAGRSAVGFTRVQYDSPGRDRGSNSSLNAEWIRVGNNGSRARRLAGWTVRDPAGHVYRFPRGFRLRPGRSVTIHTGSGRNTRTDLYWRQDFYVWNNTGDRAILRTRSGNRVDVCSWNDGDGDERCP
jgi:Lamin Tail Domain